MDENILMQTYNKKTVLVTGHMGFKGTWMCMFLCELGAEVIGYGKRNDVSPSLYDMSGIGRDIISVEGDIRDLIKLKEVVNYYKPDVVFHLAAQPIVLTGYNKPVETYETNVMGTVNVLEAVRCLDKPVSVINVTTDKVYKNNEIGNEFLESDELNGFDPYSNSKSCSELVSNTYKQAFFTNTQIKLSTMRAGNVIGGGDFQDNRIIPDCARAAAKGKIIEVRNPNSVRPYQHVLEAIWAYIVVAAKQIEDDSLQGAYNVGPENENELTTSQLVSLFCQKWGTGLSWESYSNKSFHEANLLRLCTDKIKEKIGIKQILDIDKTMELTVEWYRGYYDGKDIIAIMKKQINDYMEVAINGSNELG